MGDAVTQKAFDLADVQQMVIVDTFYKPQKVTANCSQRSVFSHSNRTLSGRMNCDRDVEATQIQETGEVNAQDKESELHQPTHTCCISDVNKPLFDLR